MPVFLAAYGTLMTGQINQLAPAVRHRMHPVGPCRIPGRLYLVRTQRAYAFPALVMSPGMTTQGELFRIHATDLPALDAYEAYDPANKAGSLYVRRLVAVQAGAGTGTVQAWVYVWNRMVRGLAPIASNDWLIR